MVNKNITKKVKKTGESKKEPNTSEPNTSEPKYSAKEDFDKIPTLMEQMKSVWEKIKINKTESIKLDRKDLDIIRNSFQDAARYADLEERWHKASKLFYEKDNKENFNYDNALREAAEIMGFVENATKKGKKKRFHPVKERKLFEDYTYHFFFSEDERLYDDLGNLCDVKLRKVRKDIIRRLADEYEFASPDALARYLREVLRIKDVPDMREDRE